jgi:hypothetical protein
MAGFIIGFDNESPGAGQRIVDFVEKTSIPTAVFSMLQALPDTGLSKRLATAGRLIENHECDINQTTLMNFVPTRPIEQIAREYVDGFWQLYDPVKYLERCFRHYLLLGEATFPRKPKSARKKRNWSNTRAMLTIFWRQGVVRETRMLFWKRLIQMYRLNPGGVASYLTICSHAEHLLIYRKSVRKSIPEQLARYGSSFQRADEVAQPSRMSYESGPGRISLPVMSPAGES